MNRVQLQHQTLESRSIPRYLNWKRVSLIGLSFLFCVVHTYSYANVESQNYDYLGLVFNPPPIVYLALGYLLAIVPAFWMPITLERPSQVVLWWLYLAVVMPSMFLPFHVLDSPPEQVVALPLSIIACFALVFVVRRWIPDIRPPSFNVRQDLLFLWLAGITLLICAAISMREGFHFNFSLEDVYTRRLNVRDLVLGGTIQSYALATLRWSIAPILVAQGIIRKKSLWVAVGVLGLACSFSFSGEKTTLFLPPYLLLLSLMVVRFRKLFGIVYCLGVITVLLAGVLESHFAESDYLSLHVSRRQFLGPAHLTAYYYEWFSQNGFTYYSDSILKWFSESRYQLRAGPLIGATYFGDSRINCVANFWAVGFSELGFLGMACYSFVLAALLRFLDSLGKRGNFTLTCLVAGLMGLSWAESSLATSMLSSGVLLSFFLLCLLQKKNQSLPFRQARRPLLNPV